MRDRIEVGDFISTDQFLCRIPGYLTTGYGRESRDRGFQGGIIYNDATYNLIWVEIQVSLGSNKTLMGKSWFEQWLWDQGATKVSHYHGNNDIFTAAEYQHSCNQNGQT